MGATLVAARVANLMVPQLYKHAIDAISGCPSPPLLLFRRALSRCAEF